MRRFVLGLTATVMLLVLTLSFKTAGSSSRGAALAPAHAAPATHTARTPAKTPAKPSGTRVVTGPTASTPYGPVQVRITVNGNRVADVVALQLPSDASYSRQVASYAAPILQQEALQAQSAHIDAVSGATYTSQGYADSLQGALDRAGI